MIMLSLAPQNMGQRRIYSVLLVDWPFLKDRRVEEERGVKKYGSSLFSRNKCISEDDIS